MANDAMKRLAVPLGLFTLFAGMALFRRDLLTEFGAEAVSQTVRVGAYVLQIGIWLTSAFLLNRLIGVFFWDLMVAKALDGPVPRLLKDVLGILIYLVAFSGIVKFVFEQPVTGIWATSGAVGIVVGFSLRSMILDIASGLAVNIDRPYRIGDWIMLHERQPELRIVGCVQQINWRTTRLRTTKNNLGIQRRAFSGGDTLIRLGGPRGRDRPRKLLRGDVPADGGASVGHPQRGIRLHRLRDHQGRHERLALGATGAGRDPGRHCGRTEATQLGRPGGCLDGGAGAHERGPRDRREDALLLPGRALLMARRGGCDEPLDVIGAG
jgi:hypothetical protein